MVRSNDFWGAETKEWLKISREGQNDYKRRTKELLAAAAEREAHLRQMLSKQPVQATKKKRCEYCGKEWTVSAKNKAMFYVCPQCRMK